MRWSEIDLNRRKWMIPRERVKNERPHEVPLSDAAIAVIKTVNRAKSRDDFVFTTTGVSAVSGFSRAKRRLDEKIKELKGEPLEHWTFHDLRRTAATGLEKLHFPLPVTEAVLNHISGSKGGIVGIYQRYEYTDEKREALDKWAEHVEKLINNKVTGRVARLRRQRQNLHRTADGNPVKRLGVVRRRCRALPFDPTCSATSPCAVPSMRRRPRQLQPSMGGCRELTKRRHKPP